MSKPHRTALMPVGTIIEHDGDTYCKTHDSKREPFPWTTENGTEYGDERVAHLLDDGGQVVEEPTDPPTAGHACPNCLGVDPASCLFSPQEVGRG